MHADFGDYYRWHYPRLVGFLHVLGASVPDAADIAQQAMYELSQQWAEVPNRRAWTCSVAVRLLAQHQQRGAGMQSPLVRAVDEQAWRSEHEIAQRISALPPQQRQVVAWKLMEFAPREIAAGLRVSPEAVQEHLVKARKALRPHFRSRRTEVAR
jgi:DNA-directed RNA polymerase specialized sigma24 family protein